LKSVPGSVVRPTSDRLRETLFNILSPQIEGKRLLDLCAGSGAIGIEALSRGAASVTFVESSRRAFQIICENLSHCGITEGVCVVNRDALTALKYFASRQIVFDLVYFDPPYESGLYLPVMHMLGEKGLVSVGGTVICEHHSKLDLLPAYGQLTHYRDVKQGGSTLSFYIREQDEPSR